jgi:DNA-binding CsgD family transcriptional regulator
LTTGFGDFGYHDGPREHAGAQSAKRADGALLTERERVISQLLAQGMARIHDIAIRRSVALYQS